MAKTEMVRARMEPDVKQRAEAVFEMLGLSATQAITMFYRQVALYNGLPFDVRIPNAETLAALEESRDHRRLERWKDFDDYLESLG